MSDNRSSRGISIASGRITRILTGSIMRLNSGEREMPRARWISFAATVLVLTCASCSQPDEPPRTASAPPSSASSTPEPSGSATSSTPSYLTKYTPDERKAYADAVGAYETFADEQARILAVGKAKKYP